MASNDSTKIFTGATIYEVQNDCHTLSSLARSVRRLIDAVDNRDADEDLTAAQFLLDLMMKKAEGIAQFLDDQACDGDPARRVCLTRRPDEMSRPAI